jgi:guanine deaminase
LEPTIHRGHVIFASRRDDGKAMLYSFPDGALSVDAHGRIKSIVPWDSLCIEDPKINVKNWNNCLIIPGFVDSHVHFPQIDILGSYGESLLGWLERYTFPAEERFKDLKFAEKAATRFVDELLASGTTTAAVFSSSHFDATNALFSELAHRGCKAHVGQVSMNRNAPDSLLTKDLTKHELEFQTLRERWHGHDERLGICITPRFAPSCTDDLLRLNSQMAASCPTALIQTHYAESKEEVEWIKELYPKSKDYLDVYEAFDLISERTILAHGIYVSADERKRLSRAKAKISHCPSSNLFLGSGIMSWKNFCVGENGERKSVDFSLGSDIGAGTSFSMWRVMGDAYKSQRLHGYSINPAELLARATSDGASMLAKTSGNKQETFREGSPADFQVIDWTKSSLLSEKSNQRNLLAEDFIFNLIWLWEPPMTKAVFINGHNVFAQKVN